MVRSLLTPSALLLPAFLMLGTALATPGAAFAAKGPLAGLDGNADGAVTRAEFDTARRADFARIDKNGDGALSRFEFYDRGGPEDLDLIELRKKRYRLLDADKDGKVTLDEYVAAGARIFAAVDRDGDGSLSGEEIAAARGTQVASRDTGAPPSSPKAEDDADSTKRERNGVEKTRTETASAARPAPAGPARSRDISLTDTDDKALGDLPFAAVDADNDGAVSLKEYDRALLVLFRRLDRNGNKVLSRHEYYRRGSPDDKARLAARKRAYRGADKDDDGGLTFGEVRAMTHGLYFRIDRDDDKRLSRAEWVAAFGPQEAPSRPITAAARPQAPNTKAEPAPPRPEPAKSEHTDKPARDVRETLNAEAEREKRPNAGRKTEMAARPPAEDTPAGETPAGEIPDKADAERLQRIAQAFATLDGNQDKHISKIELSFARMARFTALDANGNRVLERREFVGERGPAAARRFAEMDRDGDRIVIWNEYKAAGTARFAQLDVDGDGKLSLEEFSNAGKAKARKEKTGRRTVAKPDDEAETPFEYELPSR